MGQANRCEVGSKTDTPCPRLAEEFVNRRDRPDMCRPHALAVHLQDAMHETENIFRELLRKAEDWALSSPEAK